MHLYIIFCKNKIYFKNLIVFGAYLVISVPILKYICELYFENMNDMPPLSDPALTFSIKIISRVA